MGADGNIQNGDVDFVMNDVLDCRYKFARLPPNRFPWFQDDVYARMAFTEKVYDVDELLDVVILARDVVTAPEVYPLHAVDILAEMLLERGQHAFKGVGILFAECMEVQTFNAIEQFGPEFFLGYPKPGELATRVVYVRFDS